MKLKLKADPTFPGPVKVPVPGSKEPGQLVLTFKHRTKDEHKTFMAECRAEGSQTATGAGFVMAVATGWDLDEPFTPENIETVLQNYHMAETAIAIAYTHQLMTATLGKLKAAARELYRPARTPEQREQMAAFGLLESDYPQAADVIDIWPENWDAVTTFEALSTQWRTSMNGASGLDYSAIEPVLRLRGIAPDHWGEIFEALRILEGEALDVMRESAAAE